MKNLGVHTRIFTQVVRDYMAPPPPLVPGNSPIGDVVRQINDSEATSAIIVDREGIAAGIVTEHDVLRRVAFQSPPNTPVDSVMSSPCRTIPADEYLFQAIAQMRRYQLRHMPVDDGHGRVIGILHLHVAMAIAAAGCGYAQSKALTAGCEGVSRNPGASDTVRFFIILGLAFIEFLALLTFVFVGFF